MTARRTRTLGILGAGKLGTVLARLATHAGYHVLVAGSGDPDRIALTLEVLAPGAEATTADAVARRADTIVLALPLGRLATLDPAPLRGAVVVDAINHWWEVDGPRDGLVPPDASSSAVVAAHLDGARVVKGLNHMGYHDLDEGPRPSGHPDRRAIALAGDDSPAVDAVAELVDALGFDPVAIGGLEEGRRLEPGTPAFGANVGAEELIRLVQEAEAGAAVGH